MRNKLVKTLLVSILAATALSGCNSGGGSTNNSNANSNNSAQAATQTDSQQSIGAEGGLLSIIGGNIEEAITEQVGSALWNLITKGQAFPQTAAEWDKQALISIKQNIQQIEAQLNIQNSKLNTIIQDIDNTALSGSNLKVSDYLSNISDETTNVENLVQNTLPSNQSSTAIVNALITGSAQPLSTEQVESLTSYVNNYSISTLVPGFTSSKIDTTEQQLSCDPSTTGNTYYVLNNESQNALSHPMPNLSSNCLLSVALNNAYNNLTQNVQVTAGSNVLYDLQSFDQMLDTQYLQIVQALTTAYYLDQLRLYLYVNLQPSHQNHISSLLTVDPDSNNLANFSTAQAELQLAYNTRLSFVQALFTETKQNAFNHYTNTIQTDSLASNCNFNYGAIDSLSSESLNASMSSSGNSYGWDGETLTATCKNIGLGTVTTTIHVSTLCSNPSLQVSNGYIACGPSVSNYKASSEYNFTPSYSDITNNYGGASFDQLYSFYSSGNLDVYFDNNYPLTYTGGISYYLGDSGQISNLSSTGFILNVDPGDQVGTQVMAPVNDGVHVYFIGEKSIYNTFSDDQVYMILSCVPGDNNCQMANFPNPNSPVQGQEAYNALVFSNGDIISMYNQFTDHYHGNYYIQNYYNNTAPSYFTKYL